MPWLNRQLRASMGVGEAPLSYDNIPMTWNPHPLSATDSRYRVFDGQPIIGGGGFFDDTKIRFQSCQAPDNMTEILNILDVCHLYEYNIITGKSRIVDDCGSNDGQSANGVGAVFLSGEGYGSCIGGYRDTLGRTHPDYYPVSVDDDGTILVILEVGYGKGLGYLTPTDDINNPTVITYDSLDPGGCRLRNGVVIYPANGVLNRYVIATGETSTTNVPVAVARTDGNWVVGFHGNGLDTVVFEFGSLYGYQVSTGANDFNPDIRVSSSGIITVVSAYSGGEWPGDLRRYTINPLTATQYYLFSTPGNVSKIESTTSQADLVIGSDVITVGINPGETGRGLTKVISSKEWFGELGYYIRGAWQYGVTAVVAQAGNTCFGPVEVKDSEGNTWCGNEVAHGIHCVAIRPDPQTTEANPIWEVTWVHDGNAGETPGVAGEAYRRARLDKNLDLIGSIITVPGEFGSQGMLDLDENGEPIPTDANRYQDFGYVRIGLATTRGDWTIGQDVSPTCPVNRLIAWNSATKQAYVVWNGYTNIQSRLALEYDASGRAIPVVVPSARTFKIIGG